MFFETWQDFLHMGGYGFYVWLAYGISFFTLLGLIIQSYKGKKGVFAEIRKNQQREARMQAARKTGETL